LRNVIRLLQGTALVAFLLATTILIPVRALAQQNTGTISGNVTDTEGASVVNATVKLTSLDTGVTKTSKVNGRGEYLYPDVPAGNYTLFVSAPTFANFSAQGIVVNSTENIRVDAKLQPASGAATVTVEEPSATVDTRSATIATVIDQTLVQNLPIDGNNVVSLAALLPGVTGVNAPTTFTSDTAGPSYIASGSRSNQNLFLLDGLLWNNVYYNSGLNFPPSQMLSEVSVQLVNYKAQYGRSVGSVFNALTKSGTNKIHGQLWEYIQNRAFNASDYISHINPKQVQNQFGATIGGPIIRDKLFFFLGYQDLRFVGQVLSNTEMPTLAERGLQQDGVTPRPCIASQWAGKTCASFLADYPAGTDPNTGNLTTCTATGVCTTTTNNGVVNPFYKTTNYYAQAVTQLTSTAQTPAGAAQGAQQCLYDLENLANGATASSNPYILPYAEIPTECFNPVAINFTNKYLQVPMQNGVPVTVPTLLPTVANQPRNDQNGFARADLNLGRHTLDARFYVTNVNDLTQNSISATSQGEANYNLDYNSAGIYFGNLGDTWILKSNLLNIFRVGYKRYSYTIAPKDPTTFQALGAANLIQYGRPTLPRMQVSGRFSLGGSNSTYSYNVNADFEIDDSITWTRGNHNFQAGAEYLDLQYIHRYDQSPYLNESANFTGLGLADYTMGLIGNLQVGNSTNIGAMDHAFYFYAQDDWRATRRLTLNLGLRYELPFPWYQPDGQSVTFVPGYQSYKFANTPSSLAFQGDPGIPNSIIKTTYTNLAPRVGFAYDVFGNGKTAVRAGFGIFYDALNANTTGVGLPYHYSVNYVSPPGSFSQPMLNLTPVPPNYTTPANALFPFPYTVNFADPKVTEPYTQAVNLGVQQRIGQATIELSYVGKFGRHQTVPVDLNPAIYDCTPGTPYYQADYGTYCSAGNGTTQADYQERVTYQGFNYGGQGIVDNNSVGSSSYNGFQVIYTQRSKSSLTTTISYTYSRSLDVQSNGSTNTNAIPSPPNVKGQRGPSDFQATHIFNMGWNLKLPNLRTGNMLVRAVLNNWSMGGIFSAHTGNPFSVILSGDYLRNGEPNQRAPLAAGLTKYQPLPGPRHRADKVQEWFNINSFNPSPSGPNGQLYGYNNPTSRNSLYGPAFIDTDMRAGRIFNVPWVKVKVVKMEVRGDAFNIWNTPNLSNPVNVVTANPAAAASQYHGQIVSTVGKNGTVGTNGRRVQLSLNLTY
jgi:hypothetical protein